MPQFTDSRNRTWRIELDGGLVRRLKHEEQLDFFNAGDGKAFGALARSEEKVIDALWICCQEQAERQSIDTVEFARGFASGEVFEAAAEALIEAVILFTRPAMRPAIEAVRDKTREALATGVDVAATKLKETTVLTAARAKAEKAFDRAIERLMESDSLTSSPDSSALTPTG